MRAVKALMRAVKALMRAVKALMRAPAGGSKQVLQDPMDVYGDEFFRANFRVADLATPFAEEWNGFCRPGKDFFITKGDVHSAKGKKYLIEPLIRDCMKFMSNNDWIHSSRKDAVFALEAFAHYTYHSSGGSLRVCDLQGRYKKGHHSSRGTLKEPFRTNRRGNLVEESIV
jgi:hypothetical protein